MKKSFLLSLLFLMTIGITKAQMNPMVGNSNTNNNQAWSRAGNDQGQGGNLFGTRYNSPIYFVTGGGLADNRRMKLNGSFIGIGQYPINGYGAAAGVNTTGYLLLGRNNNTMVGNLNVYTEMGAFSLLHLNGPGSQVQEYGYRPWMQTGITFTGNRDLSYFGLRKLSTNPTQEDITETVILWSDNLAGADGPDKLVFRFSGSEGADGNTVSNNRLSNTDLDGLHVAQFTGTGLLGLGNTFGTNATGMAAANYVDPQSLLHSSYDYRAGAAFQGYGFHHITYRRDGFNTIGTGETAQDGFRWGIDNTLLTSGGIQHLNAYIRWQENSPLIFQTDWDNVPGGIGNGERLRIASVAAPGILNPGNYPGNTTRIALSIDGANPITQPRSLLHLGRNTGVNSIPVGSSADGYRSWMNIGAFMSDGTDNIYIGLKNEGNDRADAIINWGDNQGPSVTGPVGPDHLRFVFTASATSIPPGDPISSSQNGLETARFEPTQDVNGLPNNFGKFGVGDFYTVPTEVTHKLHVRGNGRFEYIPEEVAEHIILGKEIDPSNPDDVSFRRLAFTNDPNDVLLGDGTWGTVAGVGGILGAHNGTSMSTIDTDLVSFGQDVGDPANPGVLLSDREIPMDGFNIEFNGIGTPNGNLVSFGQPNSITGYERSKVHVYNDHENVAISGYTDAAGLPPFFSRQFGISGYITNANSDISAAVHGLAENSAVGMQGTGVFGEAKDNTFNTGVRGTVQDTNAQVNYGGSFFAGGAQTNYGIFASAGGNGIDYSGFFVGDVYIGGTLINPSDMNLKDNVNPLSNASSILNQLDVVTFDFKQNGQYERLNLPNVNQFGLIAQDVEQILPELVSDVTTPAVYDSIGNEIYPSMTYKGLNYEGLIPILAQGFKEQSARVDSLSQEIATRDSLLNDVNARLTQLESCLGNLLHILCQINNSAIYQNDDQSQSELIHTLNLELFDGENIVLEQNIPNPFAERTVINYYLPESVRDAKIIFYNQEGRMINEMKISERGNGRVNVYGADLSRGIYSYTLICDGQVIATKKMVKQ